MKSVITIAMLLVATSAFAGNGNGPGDDTIGGGTTNVTNTNTVNGGSLSATLNGGNTNSTNVNTTTSRADSTNINAPVANGGKAEQGQAQGQKQGQSQRSSNKQGQKQSADNSALNSWTYSHVEADPAAMSAAAVVVQVASACGGTGGGSGQSVGAGAAFGFSFEFKACVVLREAAFMIGLYSLTKDTALIDAAVLHVYLNIERMRKTLDRMGYKAPVEVTDSGAKVNPIVIESKDVVGRK